MTLPAVSSGPSSDRSGAKLLEASAGVIVDLLLGDEPLPIAVENDVVGTQSLVLVIPVEVDANEGRSSIGQAGALDRLVTNRRAVLDRETDELEGLLDPFDPSRPTKEPHGGAQVEHFRVIEGAGQIHIGLRKCLGKECLLIAELF